MMETIHAPVEVEIERVEAATDDVRALIQELDRELAANYPAHQRHGLGLHAIFQPHVRFFVARMNGKALGCGGIAIFADYAEIKRMYVRPEARGRKHGETPGVADAIMTRLAAEALHARLMMLKLETGTRQIAAIKFYRRCGFQSCTAFEPYSSMPPDAIAESVFLEKRIGETQI